MIDTPNTSPVGTLNKTDWKKIAVGAGVALMGALLTYITDEIPNVDLGSWTPIVVSGWSIVANTIRKALEGNEQY